MLVLVDFSFKITEKAIKEGNTKCASPEQYFSLFEPAIDWLFQCIGHGASKALFAQVFELYQASKYKRAIFL